MGNGLRPSAWPTARADRGEPICAANSPYEIVEPGGMVRAVSYTRCEKGAMSAMSSTTSAQVVAIAVEHADDCLDCLLRVWWRCDLRASGKRSRIRGASPSCGRRAAGSPRRRRRSTRCRTPRPARRTGRIPVTVRSVHDVSPAGRRASTPRCGTPPGRRCRRRSRGSAPGSGPRRRARARRRSSRARRMYGRAR